MDEHLGTIFEYQGWYAPQRMCSRNPRHRSVGSSVPETMSMEGLDDALGSHTNESWMPMQNFGQDDWMLRFPSS